MFFESSEEVVRLTTGQMPENSDYGSVPRNLFPLKKN